jgi:mannose/cellobiose epimerase-like protein (N-acyl-D-glucosamine 2-epimerase family)
VLRLVLERWERDPAYGFLDTKVDLFTGEDFPADDALRGRGAVYSWIQGRGLEALAGHARWVATRQELPAAERDRLVERTRNAAAGVLHRMERLRDAAGGRLWFVMSPDGRALTLNPQGQLTTRPTDQQSPANFSDLFYAKGLAAAGTLLGDGEAVREAQRLFDRVAADLRSGRFESDQEMLDPRNPVRPVPGRVPQGPMMIAIGGAAVFLSVTGEARYRDLGFELIERIVRGHVAPRDGVPAPGLRRFDFWEFNDAAGRPFLEGAALRCDPGHATEFVGLSLKFLRVCESLGMMDAAHAERAAALHPVLLGVLERNFENGFSRDGIGLCKAFDLVSRTPMNDDMPWWSLPETMRAAVEAWAMAPEAAKPAYARIAARCSNAFMRHYIRPDRWLMANQTLDAHGVPVPRIPATPDADPGYHTGLSLIDALQRLDQAGACSSSAKK